MKLSPNNTFVDGWQVNFMTQYGQHGSVFLSREQYTPENVAASIRAVATTMDQVHTLAG
jgi:hypothetical protein